MTMAAAAGDHVVPSYSPANRSAMAARRDTSSYVESGSASHVVAAPAWPASFDQGVEMMASPLASQRTDSFNEKSRILQATATTRSDYTYDDHGVAAGGNGAKSSFKEAVFNAINVLLGVGVLSSPFSLRSSGFLMGVPFFLFFGLVTNHTAKLLGKCLDYEEGMQASTITCVLTSAQH